MRRQTDMTENAFERLRNVLEAYGADDRRWPAADRAALAGLIASDAEARRLVAETRRLDDLLDQAGSSGAGPSEERALAGLFAQLDRDLGEGPVTAPASAPSATVVPFTPRAAASRPPVRTRAASWSEAALLAACLLLGLFAGLQGLVHDSGLSLPGLQSGSMAVADGDDVSALALGADTGEEADEAGEELL